MLHSCEDCPGKEQLEQYLKNIFEQEMELDDSISYQQWLTNDQNAVTLVKLELLVSDFIEKICETIDKLRDHHFITKVQAAYYRRAKENLDSDTALILLDFAENYSFIVQDAVQGYHWNNSQATLHTFVVYYRDSCNELANLSICILSDCLQHDADAVYSFIVRVLEHLRQDIPWVNGAFISVMEHLASIRTTKILQIYVIIFLIMAFMLSGIFLQLVTKKVLVMESVALLNDSLLMLV